MSPTAQSPSHHNTRHVNEGRVFIREYTPKYPEAAFWSGGKVGKGIQYTLDYLLGMESYDRQGNIIKCGKKVIYGVVTACGPRASRSTASSEAVVQGDYPLPPGTLFKCANSVDHKISPNESAFNNWDELEHLLPGEFRDPMLWGLE